MNGTTSALQVPLKSFRAANKIELWRIMTNQRKRVL